MSRWRLREAFVVAQQKYRAGTTLADSVGNALPGDKIEAAVGNVTFVHPSWEPLDAGATALRNAAIAGRVKEPHRKPFDQNIPCTIPGNQSVDG